MEDEDTERMLAMAYEQTDVVVISRRARTVPGLPAPPPPRPQHKTVREAIRAPRNAAMFHVVKPA